MGDLASPGLVRLCGRRLNRPRLLPLSPGGEAYWRWYGLVRSPPTASLQLGCLPRLVRVRS